MILATLVGLSGPAFAQDLELPVPSPRAQVSQQIGTVTVTVDYASPAKRGRTVWGELVPYGETWRTGANTATSIESTGDLTIGGVAVKAGKYALLTVPGESEWTVILNEDTNLWGTGGHDPKRDVAKFTAKPASGPDRERLTFVFVDTTDAGATLELEWAGTRVGLPIAVDSVARANKAIDTYASRVPRRLADAGLYKAANGDPTGGLALIEQSLAVKPTWYAAWAKAKVLSEQKDAKGAYKAAQEALALGNAAGTGFFYKDQVEKALKEWPKK